MNYPSRWDWKPGQVPVTAGVTFRFAETYDIRQLQDVTHRFGSRTASEKCWRRWICESGYTAWVAVRNNLNVVGVMVTKHSAARASRVLLYGVAPGWVQEREKVFHKLLFLATYELPENPTEIVVADDDLQTQTMLRSCGVVAVEKSSDKAEHHVFRYPAVVGLRSGDVRETGPAGG